MALRSIPDLILIRRAELAQGFRQTAGILYIAFFLSTSIFLYPVGQKFRRCFVVPDVGNRLPAVDSFVLARVCAHRTSNKDANNVKCD